MRKILSNTFISIGAVLVVAALALFLYNQWDSYQAAKASRRMLARLETQMTAQQDQTVDLPYGLPSDKEKMTTITIDEQAYVGYLSLPSLDLDLPILADWSYSNLKIAPCRFHGTVDGKNLVLMAHNYDRHFGRISDLTLGDTVLFTDINGQVTAYTVVGQDILDPYAVDEMIAGDFDLTLFTCTYGGRSRVTVYCDRV